MSRLVEPCAVGGDSAPREVAIFLTAVGLIGIAPLLLGAVYVARRRVERDPERARTSRSLLPIVVVITAVLISMGGLVAWTFSGPGASPSSMEGMDGMAGGSILANANGAAIPMELADQPLTSYVDGPDAIASVAQLHGSTFPVTDAQIGTYGDGLATIWRSGAPDAAAAVDQVERMRKRIAGGGSPFDAPHAVRGQPGVYATFGMGQKHFFFSRGASVWWVAVAPSLAKRILPEALEAST
jgi:hypothetical protein